LHGGTAGNAEGAFYDVVIAAANCYG
jgi:hypothetical protein